MALAVTINYEITNIADVDEGVSVDYTLSHTPTSLSENQNIILSKEQIYQGVTDSMNTGQKNTQIVANFLVYLRPLLATFAEEARKELMQQDVTAAIGDTSGTVSVQSVESQSALAGSIIVD